MSQTEINPLQMYSIRQTCGLLNIGRTSLHEKTVSGEIQGYRIGRKVLYKASDIQALVEKNKMKTAA